MLEGFRLPRGADSGEVQRFSLMDACHQLGENGFCLAAHHGIENAASQEFFGDGSGLGAAADDRQLRLTFFQFAGQFDN